MFGTLRLLLAIAVALSHWGWMPYGFNPGVPAVVVFYLISGYVVRALIDRHRCAPKRLVVFYGDRLLRLAPQYLCYLALAGSLWAAGVASPFLARAPGSWEWLANLFVVPLNYFMFNGIDAFTLVPPAWSLGCEIQFYLLAPWLWYGRLRIRQLAFAFSLGVYGAALAGLLNSDWFGYRLLPGVLWIFLLGGLLHDLPRTRLRIVILFNALWIAHWLWFVLLVWQPQWQEPFRREVAFGLTLGLPLLAALARLRPRTWDTALGNLSYGLFLAHFSVLWSWQLVHGPASLPPLPFYLGAAILLAGITWRLVERPATDLRHRWFSPRYPAAASPGHAARPDAKMLSQSGHA